MDTPVRPSPPEAFIYGAPMEWKSKDGTIWKITEMADEHLENCIRFMEARAESYLDKTIEFYIYGPQPGGDAATDAFEAEFTDLLKARYGDDRGNEKGDALRWLREEYPPYIAMKAVLQHRRDEIERRIADSHKIPEWLREFDDRYVITDDLVDSIALTIIEKELLHCCYATPSKDDLVKVIREVIEGDAEKKDAELGEHYHEMDLLQADLEERDHQFGHHE